MPYYLLQATYTSASWAAMLSRPQRRDEAVRSVVESLGGSLEGAWLCFGEHDTVAICRMPDGVSAAAFAMAAAAGGGLSGVRTTPLLTMDEGVEAMKKAARAGYRPPAEPSA